jgi:hypothetical protein
MSKRKRTPAPMTGAVDQAAFERAIRDNLSPEGVVAIIALLQPAGNYRSGAPENERALDQVAWFRETLLEIIGVQEFNEVIERIEL